MIFSSPSLSPLSLTSCILKSIFWSCSASEAHPKSSEMALTDKLVCWALPGLNPWHHRALSLCGFARSCDSPWLGVPVCCFGPEGHCAPSSGSLLGHTPLHLNEAPSEVLFLAFEEPAQHSGQVGLGGGEGQDLVLTWEFQPCRTTSGRW